MNELALFAGAGGVSSVELYLAGLRSARWSLNHTHATSSSNAKETASSHHAPFGMMSAPLTENHGEGLLTLLHGSCLELPTLVLPTREKEYGSLQLIPTPTCRGLDGGAHSRIKLKKLNFFPTPISHNAKELTACPSNINRKTPGLGTLAAWGALGTPGRLNPDWVEWLMGWPLGWTDLKPLEMDKYRSWLQLHSAFCAKL